MKVSEAHPVIKRIVSYRRARDGHLNLSHRELNEICDGLSWLEAHAPHLVKAAQDKAEALKIGVTELLIVELGNALAPSEARQREGE